MTFQYRYKYITDVKVANYQMVAYELVQADSTASPFTLTFPPSPTHGEVVGIKNVSFDDSVINLASAFDVETPLGAVVTAGEFRRQLGSVDWCFDAVNSIWRLVSRSNADFITEPWFSTSDTLLGNNTDIPLSFNPALVANPIFFESDGSGHIRCVRQFGGYFDFVAYFDFDASGNNEDGQVEVVLYAVSGTPTFYQGYGLVASQATPRKGNFYEQRAMSCIVIAEVNDIIGIRGSQIGGAMDVTVVAPTGISARNV